jgi:hypothetical protein
MSKVKTQTIPVPVLLTAQKAADFIGFERSTLRKLLKAGKIKARLDNGRRYFVTASLVEYIESLPDANTIEDEKLIMLRRLYLLQHGFAQQRGPVSEARGAGNGQTPTPNLLRSEPIPP